MVGCIPLGEISTEVQCDIAGLWLLVGLVPTHMVAKEEPPSCPLCFLWGPYQPLMVPSFDKESNKRNESQHNHFI